MKPIGPIPKKVKCISQESQPSNFKVGGEYTVSGDGYIRFESDAESGVVWNSQSGNSKFQPIYTDEELLEYAKKMYPEGTRFFNDSVQYRESKGVEFKVTPAKFVEVKSVADSGSVVYPDIYSPATGWVEIIDVEQQEKEYHKQTYKFKEGDPVISNISVNVKGYDTTVTDTNDDFITVDVAPSKTFVETLEDTARAAHFKNLSEMRLQYDIVHNSIQDLIRDSEDHLMFGNKAKEYLLPVPSLRVSRKNIIK